MEFLENKLFSLLRHLSKLEFKRLKGFIASGLGGPSGKSMELLEAITPFYPQFKDENLNKGWLHETLFPKTSFQEQNLRYAISDLYKQTIRFLGHWELSGKDSEIMPLVRSSLAARGADKPYESLGDPLAKEYAHGKELDSFRESFVHLNQYLSRQNRTDPEALLATAKQLDTFYVATKLKMLCELINSQNVRSGEFNFLFQGEIESMSADGAFAGNPTIAIYSNILKTLAQPNEVHHFENLQELLVFHESDFEREELRDMYKYLMNFCIKKINQGEAQFLNRLFEIYKKVLENKAIYNGRFLSQWDFKNIVVVGIRAGENKWVELFIKERIHDLAAAEQQNALTYNSAYLAFSNGDYHQALRLLQNVEFTDLYYQLDMRSVVLKCYYEMQDTDALNYHLSAFRLFLSRNKLVSEYQRTIYRNLIKFAGKLMNAKGNPEKINALKIEIENTKQIADLNWIKRKANDE
ncbi:MAG: hypothetical protein RL491_249 [Bacteroidota bacterium]